MKCGQAGAHLQGFAVALTSIAQPLLHDVITAPRLDFWAVDFDMISNLNNCFYIQN
jgi:hypothetical protein